MLTIAFSYRDAERARSISPTKESPYLDLSENTGLHASRHRSLIDPPLNLQPSAHNPGKAAQSPSDLDTEHQFAAEDTSTSQDARFDHERGASGGDAPSRARALSWQRRPTSNSPQRESIRFATPQTENSDSDPNTMAPEDETTPSRAQISIALGSKDPSWFRQTPERGIGNLALLRRGEDNMSDASSISGAMRLPGLSRESTTEPEKPTNQETGGERSRSPSRASSTFGTSSVGNRYSSMSSVSTTGGLGSPLPLSSSQRFESRKEEAVPSTSEVRAPMSPGRNSPERSVSPTKGLGGFVQSAMMKRSDSVSKRWSAQGPPRLSRSNSIISNRSGIGRSGVGELVTNPADGKPPRASSPFSTSRPGSSHSEATIVNQAKVNEESEPLEASDSRDGLPTDDGFVRPSLPSHARSMSSVGRDDAKSRDSDPQTPPKSPSRSIDPRRWSPTKATWLESALNRPESPRPKSQVLQQPAWMRDLNKTRQSRSSVDLGKPAGFKEVTPVGLMRTPPPGSHYKKPSITAPAETTSSSGTTSVEQTGSDSNVKNQAVDRSAENKTESPQPSAQGQDEIHIAEPSAARDTPTPKISPPVLAPKPNLSSRPDLTTPKPKQQPGVIDFRANLRRREVGTGGASQEEPEFKNVFGKLRRTERSNYVASDELKENIMRGKAALNTTGGPKKTQRVDDLKESILKTKEAMKAGGGSVRRTASGDERPKAAEAIPEAISKRTNLARADSNKSNVSAGSSPSSKVDSPQEKRSWGGKQPLSKQADGIGQNRGSPTPPPVLNRSGSADTRPSLQEDSPKEEKSVKLDSDEPLAGSEAASVETMQRESRGEIMGPVRSLSSTDNAGAAKVAAANKGLATKGTLAGRLNPALANILSRGPPRPGAGAEKPSTTVTSKNSPEATDPSSSSPLTHMTKGRARGPKRRLPGSKPSGAQASVKQEQHSSVGNSKAPLGPNPHANISNEIDSSIPSKPFAAGPTAVISENLDPPTPKKADEERRKAAVTIKSPELKRSTFSPSAPVQVSPQETKEDKSQEGMEMLPAKRYISHEASNSKSDIVKEKSVKLENRASWRPTPPPKSGTLPSPPVSAAKRNLPGNSFPSPSLTSKSKENIVNSTNVSPVQSKIGLGLGGGIFQSKQYSSQDKVAVHEKASASPPVPPKDVDISLNTSVDPRRPSLTSPVPRTSESARVISSFFNTLPKSSDRVNIDPQLILTAETNNPKTRTIRKQIWEITGDGKKQDLPVNQEYILFEGSMYLCVHAFESSGGNKTEVYLWCGDEVGEAAIEDAQLFARKVARENGCKLEVLRQGKETASFIQALGGIIITRRGSSSRSSSSALYMLCGRRHLGQIAFDEVDFSRRSLCSGFPFVISARFGKLYLWKGKGSGADEIGGARLIGMDLGLTGEIEEVSEGTEPESFFEVFPDHKETVSDPTTGHWHLKSSHEKYRCRLLRVDHELGQRVHFWNRRGSSSPVTRPNDTVQEIEPFCQKDLRTRDIYILDAFFELYV
jgi:hypothetical protein